ncbi:hypothetical protein EV182_006432, partial [Spiromyces aspiralis]
MAANIAHWLNSDVLSNEFLSAELVEQGRIDHYQFGKRARDRYGQLFAPGYHPLRYKFMSSELSRTSESAMAFSIGLFEGTGSVGRSNVQPIFLRTLPMGRELELASKFACPAWRAGFDVVKRTVIEKEIVKFDHKYVIPSLPLLRNMTGVDLTNDDLSVLYQACGFEYAITGEAARLCSVLTDDDRLLLEYRSDIKYSYKYSNAGAEINSYLGCDLLASMLGQIEERIQLDLDPTISDGKTDKIATRGVFRFGHSETIYFLSNILKPRWPALGTSGPGNGSGDGDDHDDGLDTVTDVLLPGSIESLKGDWPIDRIKNRNF